MIAAPGGTSHFKIISAGAAINFEAETFSDFRDCYLRGQHAHRRNQPFEFGQFEQCQSAFYFELSIFKRLMEGCIR
jgi:hypothetical protein